MRILFIHQNFPGQFKHLAPALAQRGHAVRALAMRADTGLPGVEHIAYSPTRLPAKAAHPWLLDTEVKFARGQAVMEACLQMQSQGYSPDVVIAHPGWGESLFVKAVWPGVRLGLYGELFYQAEGADMGFDPEFSTPGVQDVCRIQGKNINNLVQAELADGWLSPTRWQADTFPARIRERITVAHDGIDTARLVPNPNAYVTLNGQRKLAVGDEVITFVNRNLEPYRGYHSFMRALPLLQQMRPNARVVIVGADGVSYGSAAPGGASWKSVFLDEVRDRLDMRRVHFVGMLPYKDFVSLLQVSMVHVYLTYPFVVSWSLLEAMSLGCAVVASDVAPVREFIEHDVNGRLTSFFDAQALAHAVAGLVESPADRARLGAAARASVQAGYDLWQHGLPAQIRWVEALAT
jgi:glycosyltransferase involved in cell wall biosynthesis